VENEEARVHFIPDLKDGVFVTLCAPVVIKMRLKDFI
jgi:translation initiation factor 1A